MGQSQSIKDKILQMSAKAKMIAAGVIVAVCAAGSLAYYISIPKMSDVEKYQSNHDVAGMTKLITETMKSGNKYKDVQDSAIQALSEMKDATGSNFLIGYVTNFDKGATAEEKKEIFEAVQKNDPACIANNADKLFDYAVDQSSDAAFSDEILKVIIEDHPDYIQKNADKMTDTVANKSLSEPIKLGIVEDLIKSNPNYIQNVADKFLSRISFDNSNNETTYSTLLNFAVNDETKSYIATRIRGSIASLVSDMTDESKVLNTVRMLDNLGIMPFSIGDPLERYDFAASELEKFNRSNNVEAEISRIDKEIDDKAYEMMSIQQMVQNAPAIMRANRQFAYEKYGGDINKIMQHEDQVAKDFLDKMNRYYALEDEIKKLSAEKKNLGWRIEAQRKGLESRKNSLYYEIRNATLAYSNGEVIKGTQPTPATSSAPAVASEIKFDKFSGSGITAGVVRVQSEPTIAGKWKGRLDDEEEVKIFAKYVCNDQTAGVFDKAVNVNVADLDANTRQILAQGGNNDKILLMKGHSVQILSEQPNSYRCKLTYGKAEIVRDFPKDVIRKTYGDPWYEIESLSDGTKGCVCGAYIKLK